MPIQLTVKVQNAELVRQGLEDLDKAIPDIGRKRIYAATVRMRRRLAAHVRRPTYPIDWDSEKQRRFVLALLTRQGNLPYRPTGRYEKNWKIVKQQNGYSIENDAVQARYLSGDFRGQGQSHIHEGRRPLTVRVVEEEVQDLPQDIDDHISYYGRGLGVIP